MQLRTFWSQNRLGISFVAFLVFLAAILIYAILNPQVLNSSLAQVALTAGLVVVTAIYAWDTHKLVEAQTNPVVYMDVEWRDVIEWKSDLKIFIKNIGKSRRLT